MPPATDTQTQAAPVAAVAEQPQAYEFWRDESEAQTNVPWRVRHHSPSGFEWGYCGSGPADLALNICEDILLGLGHKGERMTCYDGTCFEVAWLAHHEFKRRFVAGLPCAGGSIAVREAEVWLLDWMINCG